VDDHGGKVVLARLPAFGVVKASAGFLVKVDAVGRCAILVRLTWNKPSAVIQAIEPTGCRDYQAALLSGFHFCNLRYEFIVNFIVDSGIANVNNSVDIVSSFSRIFMLFFAF
jgi:hypothetical protein